MVSVRCGGAMANSARNFIRFCCCLLLLFDQSAMVSGRLIRVPTSILSQTAISNPGESTGKGLLQKAETLTGNDGLFASNGTNFGDQTKTVPLVNIQQKAPNSVGGDGGPPEQTNEGANISSTNPKDSSSPSKTEEANQQGSQTVVKEAAATGIRDQIPVKTQTVVDQQRKGDESAGTKMTSGRSIDNSKANLGADGISSPLMRGQRERGTSSTSLTNKEGISQPKSAADNVDIRKGSTPFGGPNEMRKPTADSVAEPKGKGTAVAEFVSEMNGRIPSKKSNEPGPNGRRRSKSAEQGDAGEPSIEELEKQVEELDEKIKRVNEMLESSKGKKAQARSQKKLQNEIENLEKGEEKEIQFLAGWVSKLAEQKRELEQKLKGKKADKVEGRQALKKVKAEQEEVEEAQEEAVRGEQFLLEKERELRQEQEEKQKPPQQRAAQLRNRSWHHLSYVAPPFFYVTRHYSPTFVDGANLSSNLHQKTATDALGRNRAVSSPPPLSRHYWDEKKALIGHPRREDGHLMRPRSTVPKPATTTKADEPASKDQSAPAAAADGNGSATSDGKKQQKKEQQQEGQQKATLLASSLSAGPNSKADNDTNGKFQQEPGSDGQQQQTANGQSPGKANELPMSSSSPNNNKKGQSAVEKVPNESVKKVEAEKTVKTEIDAAKDGKNPTTDPAQKVVMNKPQESLTATKTGNGNGGGAGVKSKAEENNRKAVVSSKSGPAATETGQKAAEVTGTEANNNNNNNKKLLIKTASNVGKGSGGSVKQPKEEETKKKKKNSSSKSGVKTKKKPADNKLKLATGQDSEDSDSDSDEVAGSSHATTDKVV